MGSTKALANADWASIALVGFTAAVGVAALAAGFQGWAFKRTTLLERALFIVAGFALVLPGMLFDLIGFAGVVLALALQFLHPRPLLAR